MAKVIFRTQAGKDLDALLDHSVTEYGPAAARERRALWEKAVRLLGEFPTAGPSCDYVGKGLRRYVIKPHVAYYRITSDGVVILRILHTKQDARRRFS